ncbi:hypothetical protein FA15DRAFT_589106 [Coprinopsis marcescibilis]|uniref:GH10 domain-containing protein n=1 Tax=Coprinopsis marcescibilis TaxID=230819 RepID=A0A5C3LCK4_COPMA|nr:hypothetical protein FA15DRAFT_589106 [Coprinopsis marcescibilis]
MSSKLFSLVALAIAIRQAAAVGPYAQCQPTGGTPVTPVPPVTPTTPIPPVTPTTPIPPVTPTTPIPPVTPTTPIPPVTPTLPPAATPSASPNSLQHRFAAKGKQYFGACADPNTLNMAANVAVLQREFGQVTPENSMKWESLSPSRGSFNWGNSDQLVNWAVQNGKLIRGHTLVWHSQLPGWVNSINDRAGLTSAIEAHIAAVAGRYAGKLLESFVPLAFQAARRADPKAVYVRGMVNLVNRVNQATPGTIDGMGTQGHLSGGQAGGVQGALNALARTIGIKEVAITELDIQGASASEYTTVVRACLNTPLCIGITVWGVSDANSWRASGNPLLFDRSYQPKAAYTSIIGIL